METGRAYEVQMVEHCIEAVNHELDVARTIREASVFFVASMVVRGNYPEASAALSRAAGRYFNGTAKPCPTTQSVIDAGWIVDLPRLRDMLEAAFRVRGIGRGYPEVLDPPQNLRLDLHKLFSVLEQRFGHPQPVQIYIVGQTACQLYTGRHLVSNVEITVAPSRVAIPQHVFVDTRLEDGSPQVLYLDAHVNEAHSLLHPAYRSAATRIDFGTSWLQTYLLNPVDIIINRAVWLSDNDRQDIDALMSLCRISACHVRTRVEELIASYAAIDAKQHARLAEVVHLAKCHSPQSAPPINC